MVCLITERPLGRLHLKRLIFYAVVAVAAVVVSGIYGDLRSVNGWDKVIVIAAGAVFVAAGVAAFHRLATELSRVVRLRTGGAAAAAIEVTVSVAGYILVFFVALDLFSVSIQSLLVGGGSPASCSVSRCSRSWATYSPVLRCCSHIRSISASE